MKNLIKSFGYAFQGIFSMMKERNFRIEISAATAVIWFSALYGLSSEKWILLIIIISSVLSGEMINTSIEKICDKISKEKDINIKKIKDTAAGSVMLRAVAALVCAVFLFGNTDRLSFVFSMFLSPVRFIILSVFAFLSVLFIFLPEKKKRK